jgi:hypothetical protein
MKQRGKSGIRTTNAESRPKSEGGFGRPLDALGLSLRTASAIRHSPLLIIVVMALSVVGAFAETTNAPARLHYDSFRMISDRNIFNPNRVARGAPRTSRSAKTPAAQVEAFSLVGILSYEKGLFAFFEGTSADFKKVLQADAMIGQYKIASVLADVVKLTSGTNAYELKVGMQMRREDEGEWFLSATDEGSSRRRVAFSRSLTNGEPGSLTSTNGTEFAGPESGPEEVIVVEGEPATNSPEAEGQSGNGAAAAAPGATTTDPVLLRLMQRRQELNQ